MKYERVFLRPPPRQLQSSAAASEGGGAEGSEPAATAAEAGSTDEGRRHRAHAHTHTLTEPQRVEGNCWRPFFNLQSLHMFLLPLHVPRIYFFDVLKSLTVNRLGCLYKPVASTKHVPHPCGSSVCVSLIKGLPCFIWIFLFFW